MSEQEIEKLRTFCEDFRKYRNNTVDGKGENLHDIKVTFDYVVKTLDQYNLSGTNFGNNLKSKAENASNVLSQLWACLQDLEKSVLVFCDQTEKNNNRS